MGKLSKETRIVRSLDLDVTEPLSEEHEKWAKHVENEFPFIKLKKDQILFYRFILESTRGSTSNYAASRFPQDSNGLLTQKKLLETMFFRDEEAIKSSWTKAKRAINAELKKRNGNDSDRVHAISLKLKSSETSRIDKIKEQQRFSSREQTVVFLLERYNDFEAQLRQEKSEVRKRAQQEALNDKKLMKLVRRELEKDILDLRTAVDFLTKDLTGKGFDVFLQEVREIEQNQNERND